MGKIHALTKTYHPSGTRRPEWDDPINLVGRQWIPEPELQQKFDAIITQIRQLPKTDYGLIHQDAHPANLFVDASGQITLFDFDDCGYGWFIYDIAMVVFYTVMHEPTDKIREFFRAFWQGYQQENHLDSAWLAHIPLFLKYREIDLYGITYRSFGDHYDDDEWAGAYMKGRRERLLNDVPFMDVDFTQS
jgi:Ser/Thr protein kinase RdoA (MazF antagonist)